jgi:hypothetical protein
VDDEYSDDGIDAAIRDNHDIPGKGTCSFGKQIENDNQLIHGKYERRKGEGRSDTRKKPNVAIP